MQKVVVDYFFYYTKLSFQFWGLARISEKEGRCTKNVVIE